jgi:hypothetical protein
VESKSSAKAVYVVGYLPLGSSNWDLFVKLGGGRWSVHDSAAGNYPNSCVVVPGSGCVPRGFVSSSISATTTQDMGAIGAQYRFGAWGVRAEYQSISTSGTPPRLYTAGVTWTF